MTVRAAEQPALPVAGMAVGESRGLPEAADAAALAPAHDAVVRKVAEQQAVLVGEPDRSLEPGETLAQLDQWRIRQHVLPEARVMDLDAVHR